MDFDHLNKTCNHKPVKQMEITILIINLIILVFLIKLVKTLYKIYSFDISKGDLVVFLNPYKTEKVNTIGIVTGVLSTTVIQVRLQGGSGTYLSMHRSKFRKIPICEIGPIEVPIRIGKEDNKVEMREISMSDFEL